MAHSIILSTLNASFHHSAFGLRYLKANLKTLEPECLIIEYTIHKNPELIVQELVQKKPRILGFGVYIWNTSQTQKVLEILKARHPEIIIVLGGPEVSHETATQKIIEFCDYVICGEADFAFRELCEQILHKNQLPEEKIIRRELPDILQIQLPYALYSDEDIKNRTIYVEASRGCPYKCEYCLSSLDKSVRNFEIHQFLWEMDQLFQRGVRQFKFIDRTFNLSPRISQQILAFFLQKLESDSLFLHFEMVPDRLPDELKLMIQKFPAGSLQFEIGVQTWNEQVASLVSRRQDYSKVEENLRFLRSETHVHSHVDLIGGLPGETLESFKIGFDRLARLAPDEIQVGVLKRLKGTPIIRHDKNWEMVYSKEPPFQILSTKTMPASEILKFTQFAKFWDLIANRGQFKLTCEMVQNYCEGNNLSLFEFYWDMTDFLMETHEKTYSIHLNDLFKSVSNYLEKFPMPALETLHQDYHRGERYYTPDFLRLPTDGEKKKGGSHGEKSDLKKSLPKRQNQHLN